METREKKMERTSKYGDSEKKVMRKRFEEWFNKQVDVHFGSYEHQEATKSAINVAIVGMLADLKEGVRCKQVVTGMSSVDDNYNADDRKFCKDCIYRVLIKLRSEFGHVGESVLPEMKWSNAVWGFQFVEENKYPGIQDGVVRTMDDCMGLLLVMWSIANLSGNYSLSSLFFFVVLACYDHLKKSHLLSRQIGLRNPQAHMPAVECYLLGRPLVHMLIGLIGSIPSD
ncbi:hypothetical protein Tco_0604256 [Tanacetum coccineum]